MASVKVLRERVKALEAQLEGMKPLEKAEIMDLRSAIMACPVSKLAAVLKIIQSSPSYRKAIDWEEDEESLVLEKLDPPTLRKLQEVVGSKALEEGRQKREREEEQRLKRKLHAKEYRERRKAARAAAAEHKQ